VDTVLIAGLDSVAGINLAGYLADRYSVVGVSFSVPVSLEGCHSGYCPVQDENDIREWVESVRPDHLIYCGPASHSAWEAAESRQPDLDSIDIAANWAAAARDYGARLTVISSDAVFTGPWIFHDENSTCRCESRPARCVGRIEKSAARQCPGALIVRTHVFGWSHDEGMIERIVAQLDAGNAGPFDYQRHATPILATDFAEVLEQAWDVGLDGTYHIAGAERINPNRFVRRLAEEFGLPSPHPVDGNRLLERPVGYGCGETSLHSMRLRRALGIAMPSIGEGLLRLREQRHNGFADALKSPVLLERAA